MNPAIRLSFAVLQTTLQADHILMPAFLPAFRMRFHYSMPSMMWRPLSPHPTLKLGADTLPRSVA